MIKELKGIRNNRILELFTGITRDLNKSGIKPLIYGSLGLTFLMGEHWEIDDIDLIVLNYEEFEKCREISVQHGFILDPDHDRELMGHDTYVSFIDLADIEKLLGRKIKYASQEYNGVFFNNLALSDYRDIYKAGLADKYRRQRKEKDDTSKIEMISFELNRSSNSIDF